MTTKDLLSRQPTTKFGLYIHVPFCRTKCNYCDFFSIPISGTIPNEYVEALIKELGDTCFPHHITSIYLGGGTPSLLNSNQIEKILSHIHKIFNVTSPEITIECNPDDITKEYAHNLREIGINRISIGIQSFNDQELYYLGRRHNATKATYASEVVSNYFSNWSLDLIYGIPCSGVDHWIRNLQIATAFMPTHISTYCLTYEKGTFLYEHKNNEKLSDDTTLEYYKKACLYLKKQGYYHYEISNFAKKGYQCKHNLLYWENKPYVGIGAGSFSFISNIRCANNRNIVKYINSPGAKEEIHYLTEDEIKDETLIQHFRLMKGIKETTYFKRFNSEIKADYGEALHNLLQRRLIRYINGYFKPTKKGVYLNNEIGIELLMKK